jgi:hypothetical protein
MLPDLPYRNRSFSKGEMVLCYVVLDTEVWLLGRFNQRRMKSYKQSDAKRDHGSDNRPTINVPFIFLTKSGRTVPWTVVMHPLYQFVLLTSFRVSPKDKKNAHQN